MTLRKIYDQAYLAYLYFWGGKKSGFINYGYWNDETTRPSDAHFLLFDKLFALVQSKRINSLLDLGCGFGGGSLSFLERTRAKVMGVTHSGKQVAVCKERCANFSDRVQFIESDYHDFLTNTNESFDLVWAVESLYHEKDKKAFLQKLESQLNRGGKILVVDYYLSQKESRSEKLNVWKDGYKVGELLTAKDFEEKCIDIGLDITDNLDWSIHVAEGSRRIKTLGRITFPFLFLMNKVGLVSNDFLKGTKASIAQYDLFKSGTWQYKVYVLEKALYK